VNAAAPSTFRPQALLSFPFFGIGLASFFVLVVWLLVRPETVLEPPRAAAPLAFVHLAILGWLAPFVFGAAYQLIPVVSEAPLWSRTLAWMHLGIHAAGASLLLGAMIAGDFGAAGTWGGLVAVGMALGVLDLVLTASRRSRWAPDNVGLLLALFWLLVAVVLGVLLTAARTGRFTAFPAERLLQLHMTCGVVGFFVGTLVAVSFKLVPMFLLGPPRTRARAWASIGLINAGLLVLGPGLLGEADALAGVATVSITAGGVLFLVEIALQAARRLRPLDWPLRTYFLGAGMLLPASAVGAAAAMPDGSGAPWLPERAGAAVFVLVVFGVLTPCILGMAGKIVPFLAWQWRYAGHVGRARVPLVADLFRVGPSRLLFFAAAPAMACLAAGVFLGSTVWLRFGAAGFLAAAGAFAVNVAGLVPHLVHPKLAPLAVPGAGSARAALGPVRASSPRP
jgi:hypothetical protein